MQKLTVHRTLSALTIVVGALLLVYMIAVESEPGAVPLLMIGIGTGWYLVARFRTRPRPE